MEGMGHSISAHTSVVAAQLQAQHAHVKAQQAAAFAQQHRNNSFVWQQQQQQQAPVNNTTTAQMQNGYSNFMPSMMAMQANNMNQMAMVATAKLAPSKKNKASNSTLAVRSTVPRFNVAGGIYTVAQWARKCVEDNLEFIVKIARRGDPKADSVMLAYGDGCQTLVFFDDAMNKVPKDLSKIAKIHVGVSAATIDDKRNESEIAASGVLQPIDSLWDHLRYEQAIATLDKEEKIMFIHTSMTVYGDSVTGRQRVLQIKTKAPTSPFVADSYMRNVMFEQQVLAKWNGQVPEAIPSPPQGPMGMAAEATFVAVAESPPPDSDDAPEYLITFNPKELLLLEKAFDNALTPRDLKSKADKWSDEDQKKCQLTIIRANNEFKYVRPRKPNKKKAIPAEKDATAEKYDPSEEPGAKAPDNTSEKEEDGRSKEKATEESPKKIRKPSIIKKGPNPKKSPKNAEKKENPVDSDDEPIVKLKTPTSKANGKATSKKATPTKKASKLAAKSNVTTKTTTSTKKAKTLEAQSSKTGTKTTASKKRGRDKSVGPPPKKTRANSKVRTTRSKK